MSTQKRPVKLTEDVLYVLAERLLARIPDNGQKIDFHYNEKNPYALFMGHNEKSFRTIIAQFAKFKRIDFAKFGADEQIEFYKNEDKYSFNDSEPAEFRGPYIIPKGMLEYIIEKGKFRVNTIETVSYLPDDHTTDIKGIEGMNSLKAFCALFFGKQIEIPEGLSNNLMVKKFKIDESVENIQNNFETILAIDAVELEISNRDNVIIDCSQYKGLIIAKNTTKIAINCQFNFQSSKEEIKKFGTNFETFCSFLVRTCPTLRNLNITICSSLNSIDSSIGVFVENFYSIVKAMEQGIESINTGNENLQISIELVANFPPYIYDDLPIQSHDLFKLGTPFTVESIAEDDGDRYVARSLDCVDVGGRNHKLLFKFFEEIVSDDDSMDFYDYGYDDDGGYDDYEDHDVDDEVDYDDEPY